MIKVKICGVRTLEEAQWAVEAGADAIGFVFAESKRRISVREAADISSALPDRVMKIGVFVNESKQNLESTFEQAGLDYVQLHGDETPEFCRTLSVPFIKAISIKEEADVKRVGLYPEGPVLVDSGKGPHRGGNGTTFQWDYLKGIEMSGHRIILAGGLNVSNIGEAIREVRPEMVDLSSGVETDGRKDREKIFELMKTVKQLEGIQ